MRAWGGQPKLSTIWSRRIGTEFRGSCCYAWTSGCQGYVEIPDLRRLPGQWRSLGGSARGAPLRYLAGRRTKAEGARKPASMLATMDQPLQRRRRPQAAMLDSPG